MMNCWEPNGKMKEKEKKKTKKGKRWGIEILFNLEPYFTCVY
jgi:hypothetical protein